VKVLDIPLALHPGEGIGCGGMATIEGVGTRFDGSHYFLADFADGPDSRGM
jgi:hypothetical protein